MSNPPLSRSGLKLTVPDKWSKSLRPQINVASKAPFIAPKGTRGPLGSATTSFNRATDRITIPGPSSGRTPRNAEEQKKHEEEKKDALKSEFIYYSTTLKTLAPTLTNPRDRKAAIPWINKLFEPEYHIGKLRNKRNRFMCSLVISIFSNELPEIFHNPPFGSLPNTSSIRYEPPSFEWERDITWITIIDDLPSNFPMMLCSVPGCPCKSRHAGPIPDPFIGDVLDEEFHFLLSLTKRYDFSNFLPPERDLISAWRQLLCTINRDACDSMKGIRNDYMMAFLGYLHDGNMNGPFATYPEYGKGLAPLSEAAALAKNVKGPDFMDPTGAEADYFLSAQPIPEEGAFAYICLTGDMLKAENFK